MIVALEKYTLPFHRGVPIPYIASVLFLVLLLLMMFMPLSIIRAFYVVLISKILGPSFSEAKENVE